MKTVWCQTLDLKSNTIKKVQLTTAEVDKRFSLYSNTKGAKFAISPNQKYLAVDTQVVGHDEDYLLCGNDPRPSVREFQFYDIQANNFQTIFYRNMCGQPICKFIKIHNRLRYIYG